MTAPAPSISGTDKPPATASYDALLAAAVQLAPCDAAALLKLEGDTLRPVAVHGLTEEALSRQFPLTGHPRLATLMRGDGFHRFPPDCGWPDPYDGLIHGHGTAPDELLPVHDCMGAPLHSGGRAWGVITFDALRPDAFDALDDAHRAALLTLLQGSLAALEGRSSDMPPPLPALPRAAVLRSPRALMGQSVAMQQLIREVDTVAASDLTVLILGETGVGKELVAQRLHEGSRRSLRPLVQLNCAALPETLADSELFGHRRGAFTGATQDRTGKFELAEGGTLLLDEVGELPLPVQAKLLRTLQSGDIQRPGSDRALRVNVRILAATNRDLRAEVAAGRFRADLYHRLAVYPVHVPPLRERGREVLTLAGMFLEENQQRLGAHNLRLSPAARDRLLRHHWPGNVRELEHLISRAALRAWAEQRKDQRWVAIDPDHLGLPEDEQRPERPAGASAAFGATPPGGGTPARAALSLPSDLPPGLAPDLPTGLPPDAATEAQDDSPAPDTLRAATDRFQRDWLAALLARHPTSMAAAAREAGMDRSNFHRLIKKLGLNAKGLS